VGEEELAVELIVDVLNAVVSRRYTVSSRKVLRAALRRGLVMRGSSAAALLKVASERGFVIDARGRVWRLKLLRGREVRLAAEVVGTVEAAQAVSGG
jgi:hypothetical protein